MKIFKDEMNDPTETAQETVQEVLPVKKERKKRIYTEEQKEQMKQNLAKARRASALKRKENQILKKIDKEADDKIKLTAKADKLKNYIEKNDSNDHLYKEIESLKYKLRNIQHLPVVKEESQPIKQIEKQIEKPVEKPQPIKQIEKPVEKPQPIKQIEKPVEQPVKKHIVLRLFKPLY